MAQTVKSKASDIDGLIKTLGELLKNEAIQGRELSSLERKRMRRLGKTTSAFANVTANAAAENQIFIPKDIDPDEFQQVMAEAGRDKEAFDLVKRLYKMIEDRKIVSEDTALKYSLLFYREVRAGSKRGAQGAAVLEAELKKYYRRGRPRAASAGGNATPTPE